MKRDLKPIREKLRKDPRCERLHTIFSESSIYKIDTEGLTKEIQNIHSTRNVRFLSRSEDNFIEKLCDASIRDQSNRSRLAEIAMQCYRAESSLDEAIQPLKEYLILKYGPEMSFVRTKDERSKLVDMALRPLLIFTSKVRIVRELANMVVSDIDKASFSLQRQIDIYKLTNKPERTI